MAYPKTLAEKVPWHATFNQECIDNTATFVDILTATNLGKILANKNFVATLINYADLAKNFSQEVVAYRDIWLGAPLGSPVPAAPIGPAGVVPPLNVVVGIDAFTRGIIAQLDAHPNMTDAIRAAMGILPDPRGLGLVSIIGADALGGSQVRLRMRLAGYKAVAVDRRRAGGDWEQVAISITAEWIDEGAPIVANVSESREYRIQGIIDNVRQGDISSSVLIATTP